MRNEKDAEDAAQEVFVKIFYALPRYNEQGIKTWITRIAVNHAIDLKRKEQRQAEKITKFTRELPIIQYDDSLDTILLAKEQRERMRIRLKELPDHYKSVIEAYYLQDKSYKQIAADQQVETKTIEMKLYRARVWIRKHWKEEDLT